MPEQPSTSPSNAPEETSLARPHNAVSPRPIPRRSMAIFAGFVVILSACFFQPLLDLAGFAYHSEFFSYIPLIPLISLYLVWIKKAELPRPSAGFSIVGTLLGVAGLALAGGLMAAVAAGRTVDPENYLTVAVTAYLLLLAAGCLTLLGRNFSRSIVFPLAFLAFMIPMPSQMLHRVEYFLQVTSAATASGMLGAAGMTVIRDIIDLHLPGYSIQVAPECSGIHSTMVLLIVSTLAAHMFLRSGWRRAALVVFVLPLAILRNGFRVFVISELCVQISHDMINSPIHRKGGPIFFALSLIPFFALLWYLRRSELSREKTAKTTPSPKN